MNEEKRNEETVNQLKGLEQVDLELTIDDLVRFFYDSFSSQAIHIESLELALERDRDRYVYEIEGWDEEYRYELKVNAKNLRIIAQEKKENFEPRDILDLTEIIPPKEAMMTAIEASTGTIVEEWELEMDQNHLIYAIDLVDGEDQKVNALTGELLSEMNEDEK